MHLHPLRKLFGVHDAASKRKPRGTQTRARSRAYRPQIEALETRTLLSLFVVNSTGDLGVGFNKFGDDTGSVHDANGNPTATITLRSADEQAVVDGGGTIDFGIPGGGVQTIFSTGIDVGHGTIIDGTTQPGFQLGKPVIQVEGDLQSATGFYVAGSGSTIKGLVISGFRTDNIELNSVANNNKIQGCYIGTNIGGVVPLGNALYGVVIALGSGNTIGGTNAGEGNVISGNQVGIGLQDRGNVVQGNLIGTTYTGMFPLPNTEAGISVISPGNTIGGTTPGAGNVISGNNGDNAMPSRQSGDGIQLFSGGNLVQGNLIGTNQQGTAALGNHGNGVHIHQFSGNGASSNTIGGAALLARNVISGNLQHGVLIENSNNNVVVGNYIGTNANGTPALGNQGAGVSILADATRGGDAASNRVGGIMPGEGNLISGNGTGVALQGLGGALADNNLIQGNLIGTDTTGAVALGNGVGVGIGQGAPGNTVGGTAIPARNIISGNQGAGVGFGIGSYRSVVEGNYIGTDSSGLAKLGNGVGVGISDGHDNTIGGIVAGSGNLISGNQGDGVQMQDIFTVGTLLANNFIGTATGGIGMLGNGGNGVSILFGGSDNTIGGAGGAGNVISANAGVGIEISGVPPAGNMGNLVQGNRIGTNIVYDPHLSNGKDGVLICNGAANNTIGATDLSDANLILSNGGCGVHLTDAGTMGNLVQNNYIGTDATGTLLRSNGADGVFIANGASGNTIGGMGSFTANVISGNKGNGIQIPGAGTAENVVEGNAIGTDAKKDLAMPNLADGVLIAGGAANNTIGVGGESVSNVISGNTGYGVHLTDAATMGNVIDNNYIGTDGSGTAALGNGKDGVLIAGGASNNHIGFGLGVSLNLISGNKGNGVQIAGPGTAKNVIDGNGIGVDINEKSLSNGSDGVLIVGGAANNMIGMPDMFVSNFISGNTGYGVHLTDAGTMGNLVQNNSIGTAQLGNGKDGVFIAGAATGNTIGGVAANSSNFISGNKGNGIQISGAGTANNVVQNNYVGTDPTGKVSVPNGGDGVLIGGGAANNTIGTAFLFEGNLISGNTGYGVHLTDAGTVGNVAQNNYIGTDLSGTVQLSNGKDGVFITAGASANTVGGVAAFTPNLISSNKGNGIQIAGAGTVKNVVEGNYVGTDVTGKIALPNGGDGVLIAGGAANNTIGAPGFGNLISGNTRSGVGITDVGTTGNLITQNSITKNTGLGIDLGDTGTPLLNDSSGHGGPNKYQNFPVLTSAIYDGTSTTITGFLQSAPISAFTIEFFSNTAQDPSGYGEGETYQASLVVVTDATGRVNFTFPLAKNLLGVFMSATATDPGNNTSEFSADFVVSAPVAQADLAISKTDGSATAVPGTNVTYTITVTNNGPSTVTGATVSDVLPAGTSFVSATGGATYNAGTNTVSYTTGTLVTGGSASFTLTLAISPTLTGTLANTATVSPPSGVTDTNMANNSSTDTDTLTPQADLVLTNATSASVIEGANLTHMITIHNNGPVDAAKVVVTDVLPANVHFVSASFGAAPVTVSGNTVTVILGTVANGSTVQGIIMVQVPEEGTLANMASVSSSTIDPDLSNNSQTANTTVTDPAVVATPGTASPVAGAPFSGSIATFIDPAGAETNDSAHYSVSLTWGDGSAAFTAPISFSGGIFTIGGTHTYAAAGSYTVTATISHKGVATTLQETVLVSNLGQSVPAQMVKPLGFWQGLQGQQLIRRFGLTTAGQSLGQWLATTFPNLYGGNNGAPNLSPFTNAQIGGYYQSLFLASKGTGLDAEVLATALEVFATTTSLGGTVGQSFGFMVTDTGLGAYSWNIGPNGLAFGVTNNTVLDVYQILLAANNTAVGGEPWNSNTFLRNQAFSVFHGINGG